jgi:hypothetical protein
LSAIRFIPTDTPILKISGRYYLTTDFAHRIGHEDIVARVTQTDGVNPWMSTRCYLVKNASVLEAFLRAVLRDLYGYGARVVGPRSLYRILRHSLFPDERDYPFDDPVQGIEVSAARVILSPAFKVQLVRMLGVEGISGDCAQALTLE